MTGLEGHLVLFFTALVLALLAAIAGVALARLVWKNAAAGHDDPA